METLRRICRRVRMSWALPLLILQSSALFAAADPEPIHVGDAFRIESKVLQETRRYLVRLPRDYAFVDAAYPVLMLLDGDSHFHVVSATVDLLASTGRIPEVIVVGVSNTDRFRDLSPEPRGPANEPGDAGPKRFLSFLGDELLPHIDRSYRTRPYRLLVGHSAGGLFVVYALMSRPTAFKGYIAISPALADNRALVKDVEPFLLANKELQGDFYMTMADERGTQLGGAWELASLLQEKAPRSFRWQFVRHPEENHFSVVHRSVYDGLQALFQGWYLQDPFALYEQGGLAAIEKHYGALSARVGYDVPVAQRSFTYVINSLSSRSRFAEAEPVVTKALESYPDSFDVHFALGRLFIAMKDDARAIKHWTRVLELSPETGFARTTLASLKVDPDKIVPTAEIAAAPLASYIGRYRAPNVELLITRENGELYVSIGLDRHRLKQLSATAFTCADGDKRFTFKKGRRDRIAGLVVRQGDKDLELTRVN